MDANWILETTEERHSYERDWHAHKRDVQLLIGDDTSGTKYPIERAFKSFVRPQTKWSGLLVQARSGDGLTWIVQAAINRLQQDYAMTQVAILARNGGASIPEVVNLVGTKFATRAAQEVGLLPKRGALRALFIALAIGCFASLAALSDIALSEMSLDGLSDFILDGRTLMLVAAGSIFVGAERTLRVLPLDRSAQYMKLTDSIHTALKMETDDPRTARKINDFVDQIVRRIAEQSEIRLFIVDDYRRLHTVDRRVVQRLLHSSANDYKRRQGDEHMMWLILDTSDQVRRMSRTASRTSYIRRLKRCNLLPLEPRRIARLARQRGITDFDDTQVLKYIGARDPLEGDWSKSFRDAARGSLEPGEASDLHVLWILAVGGSLGIQPAMTYREISSLLSSHDRLRDEALAAALKMAAGLTSSYVEGALKRLTSSDWASVFVEPELVGNTGLVRVKPRAARVLSETALGLGFGNRALASVFWALYWDEHSQTGYMKRTYQVSAHLKDAARCAPNLSRLMTDDLREHLANVTARIARQCLEFAEMVNFRDLFRFCHELLEHDDKRMVELSNYGYIFTRELDLAILEPNSENEALRISGKHSRILMARLARMIVSDDETRKTLLSSLLEGKPQARTVLELEEAVLQVLITRLSEQEPHHVEPLTSVLRLSTAAIEGLSADTKHISDSPLATGKLLTQDELSLSVAMLCASTAVVALSWALICHKDSDSLPSASEVVNLVESAGRAVSSVGQAIDRCQSARDDSWPLVLDTSSQQLSLMVASCLELLKTEFPDACDTAESFSVPTWPANTFGWRPGTGQRRLKPTAELLLHLWQTLQLPGLATSFAQQFELVHAALGGTLEEVGFLLNLPEQPTQEGMFLDFYRSLTRIDNAHLKATYFAQAVYQYLGTGALEAQVDAAIRSVRLSEVLPNPFSVPILELLHRELDARLVVNSSRPSELARFANAVFNCLHTSEHPALFTAYQDAFEERLQAMPAGYDRDELRFTLDKGRLKELLTADTLPWEEIVASYGNQTTMRWYRVLILVAQARGTAEQHDGIDQANQKAISEIASRAKETSDGVSWNEIRLAAELSSSSTLRPLCLEILSKSRGYIIEKGPVVHAQYVARLLAANRMPISSSEKAYLDARHLEHQAVAVFPDLLDGREYFRVYSSLFWLLRGYNLEVAETQGQRRALSDSDCGAIIAMVSSLEHLPYPIDSSGGASLTFVRYGDCLVAAGRDASYALQRDFARVNELSKEYMGSLLEAGAVLSTLPLGIRRVLGKHFQRYIGFPVPLS